MSQQMRDLKGDFAPSFCKVGQKHTLLTPAGLLF